MRSAKTLIKLGGCPGWSESSLGVRATLFVLSRGGSNGDSLKLAESTNFTEIAIWPIGTELSEPYIIGGQKSTAPNVLLMVDDKHSGFPKNKLRIWPFLSFNVRSSKCYYNGVFFSGSIIAIWAASWQNQQCSYAPSEDSDQPGHPPSLIRVFAVRPVGS